MFPVEEKFDEIRAAVRDGRDVVLTAPPGSGKTTCVPPALLNEPFLKGKKIVMLEPRRLAARNCATYMARRLGETVGETVGYQVRLERKIGRETRLEVVTEGLLTQRILSDPELTDVGLVIFDEFHERSLSCDLAFALTVDVQRALRPDLRIMIMSATLDVESIVASFRKDSSSPLAVIEASGRMFPVETRYLGDLSVRAAVDRALDETDGDILCFLPGEGEIRRAAEGLRSGSSAHAAVEVLPLYGALPKEEQDRVFAPKPVSVARRVILATSIAETSLTLPGITAVIDSGLMRVPRFSSGTGMTGLVTLPLTMDRAEQRRGRAGRVRAGVCYRLWSEASESSRPRKMMPEILDADLCSLVLTCLSWGALRREDLPWLTMPPASAWNQALSLLKLLGAVDAEGRLTDKGRAMSKLPMHPRLANMLLGSRGLSPSSRGLSPTEDARVLDRAALLAAIIEEGGRTRETDIRKVLDEVIETPNRPFSRRILQLSSRFSRWGQTPFDWGQTPQKCTPAWVSSANGFQEEGALLALAYPDRVAKNRGNGTFCMVSGRGIAVETSDPLCKANFIVGCVLDDRPGDARLFLGSPISEEAVLNLFSDQIEEEPFCEWDRRSDRVKAVVRRRLGSITLGEIQIAADAERDQKRACVLDQVPLAVLDGVRQKGVENLPCWTKETLQLRSRIRFLSRHLPDAHWPTLTDEELLAALLGFVSGVTKWRDLERLDIAAVMDFVLAESGHDRRELDRLAPIRMEVPSGSHMTIHYEGDEPTVAVRLQECFGLMETPKVAGGKVPIVMTLLSPAQRPIQITKDLAGFWRGAYQLVRKDMRGRYPKHDWPEDPFSAIATRRGIRGSRG